MLFMFVGIFDEFSFSTDTRDQWLVPCQKHRKCLFNFTYLVFLIYEKIFYEGRSLKHFELQKGNNIYYLIVLFSLLHSLRFVWLIMITSGSNI